MHFDFTWPGGKSGACATSWDDGTVYDFRLVEILNRYGLKGTFNLNSGKLGLTAEQSGWKAYVRPDDIPKLYVGHEVASHTVTHPRLDRLPDDRVLSEIIDDCATLERIVGYPIRGFALPYGRSNDRVASLIQKTGIAYVRPVEECRDFSLPDNFHYWRPTCHHNADITGLWSRFIENKSPAKLFDLWGHSYEFEDNRNWSHIEEFARIAGGSDSIWFATNDEICDYVVNFPE
ncbi:MAG: polysaccharide deacetylase family protein [Chitinivibrionales bacterium]|nr:polysaccharide deacetylase family protein [Chitinivibrionales bacterium]